MEKLLFQTKTRFFNRYTFYIKICETYFHFIKLEFPQMTQLFFSSYSIVINRLFQSYFYFKNVTKSNFFFFKIIRSLLSMRISF